ncbi:potassium channel subfamily K member 1-like isoform X2 [Photinus pyralis]|uniref:Potassium channel subfamily K member 1 n=1 Tax=Photinus pyralis TaxID=7054 RepID=A0A1Y1NKX1_PHOPY|nr:potassium channel subfamily K member 1-like isoform X2 [Photinus pyralis]
MGFFNKGAGRLVLYGLGYIIFLILGALVFSAIETPEELGLIQKLRAERASFLSNHQCVEDDALESLITEIVLASNRGVSATRNASGTPNWSFGQSLFFSSTVITTIGYGHVTPLSRSGKIFCVLYATIGIPLTLVLLSALVERLLVPTVWFLQFLNSRLGHLYQPLNIRLFHLFIIVCFFLIFFLLVPAAIFATCEPEWDYLDSFYYCFISLTTIGLGDYIPGDSLDQPNRPIYKIATAAYLFIGITFMMLTLAVFYDIPQLNLGMLFSTSNDVNSEKVRLAGSSTGSQYGAGGLYNSTIEENTHRHVVRVRSRRDDSPSPEESAPKELRLP